MYRHPQVGFRVQGLDRTWDMWGSYDVGQLAGTIYLGARGSELRDLQSTLTTSS